MLEKRRQSDPPYPSDDLLIGRFRQGDAEAFEMLFDRHNGGVYRFARHMLGNDHEAEEVLQETFLAVARTARTYQPRGLFQTWLMRIVRNRCLNRMQSAARMFARTTPAEPDNTPSPTPSPLQDAQTAEHMARVHAMMGLLPQRQREALVLFALEQMSYAQIAQVLDMPINTVKTLIFRARSELARSLEEPSS